MIRTSAIIPVIAILAAGAERPLFPQGFGGEVYDLRDGSVVIDECVPCDRAPIERPLAGSFTLTQIESFVCCVYEISDLAFEEPSGDYAVKGGGMYSTSSITDVTQQMSLDLSVGGTDGVKLESGAVKVPVPFPAIDITVTEDGKRDPFHKYTIRLVAAPRTERVLYELVEGNEGSYFQDSCIICERPEILIPIAGTFRLALVSGGADPNAVYTVDVLDFHSTLDGQPYRIAGSGIYEQGGEVALTQHMNLGVQVNDDSGVILDNGTGPIPNGVVFPIISIDLAHQNPRSELHVYSLHLVARPAKPRDDVFRRGDSNGDGSGDISDAVHILLWRFSGGAAPGCLDAADTNGDGAHDLTDAVFFLLYLFQGGQAPPAPGAESCGVPKAYVFGCESYTSCGA